MGRVELPNNQSPQSRRSRRKLRLPISFISALALLVYAQLYLIPQILYKSTPSALKLAEYHNVQLSNGLAQCAVVNAPKIKYTSPAGHNPRWQPKTGQKSTSVLRNATLFDGERVLSGPVDIVFEKGTIKSVKPASHITEYPDAATVLNLSGKFVTPGIVDMHSHHLSMTWPQLSATEDGNEMHPDTGPLTPMMRVLDSLKPYDQGMALIASGGITTSLILPGSANIMGGEGFLVKNIMQPGENDEEVVEDLLLEHGIKKSERRRYLKMACGENPSRTYKHTRMGNAWILRKHMTRAQVLLEKQNEWCLSAAAAQESGDIEKIASLSATAKETMYSVEALELDSTMAMLRGTININIHCYEPEDFEDMLLHSHEFGFRVSAFHHALSAWKVPEMLKEKGENLTVAIFSDFGLYKKEAYDSNVYAGKILAEHHVPVAYKSDHSESELSAKYLMFQAATGHSYGLPAELALQSVTSVPAKSLEIDHRVGYAKSGYDADLVVWDSHPLSAGATPLQVFIDGRATLDPEKVRDSFDKVKQASMLAPQVHANVKKEDRDAFCSAASKKSQELVIKGISKSFLTGSLAKEQTDDAVYTMILKNGKITCLGMDGGCVTSNEDSISITLQNGHVAPGLIAVSSTLGLTEIDMAKETADGIMNRKDNVMDETNVDYAQFGVHLDGKAFARARFGGVTKAITHPVSSGFAWGVSTGIKTSGKQTILNGGIWQDDVALHFLVGQDSKGSDHAPTISAEIYTLRRIISENENAGGIYGKAAKGNLPLVVHVQSKYDILQLVKIKNDFPAINLVVFGGAGAAAVATELAEAKIPVILAPVRGAPDSFEKLDTLPGPPLTKSPAEILTDAGVFYGVAIGSEMGDARIQNLMIEAAWAAKFAGLTDTEAVNLVSKNIVEILHLDIGEENQEFVIYEGNPLELGASVVLTIDGEKKEVVACWPEVQ